MSKNTSKSGLVEFGDYTDDDAEVERASFENSKGAGRFIKLKGGKTTLRAVPPPAGKKWKRTVWQHSLQIGDRWVMFNCPKMMASKSCKTCAKADRLLASRSNSDNRKGKDLRAKRQCFANFVVRESEELGPRTMKFGSMIDEQLIEVRRDEDTGGNFAHPISGFDLRITKSGEKMSTTYKVVPVGKAAATPLHDNVDVMNEWIQSQPDLDLICEVLTEREIDKLIAGDDGDEDEDDEFGAPPRGSKDSDTDEDDDDEF